MNFKNHISIVLRKFVIAESYISFQCKSLKWFVVVQYEATRMGVKNGHSKYLSVVYNGSQMVVIKFIYFFLHCNLYRIHGITPRPSRTPTLLYLVEWWGVVT